MFVIILYIYICINFFRQIFSCSNVIFYFKFIFRYQFFLQIKQDIVQGRLPVTFDLAAELGAYVVQCEFKNII